MRSLPAKFIRAIRMFRHWVRWALRANGPAPWATAQRRGWLRLGLPVAAATAAISWLDYRHRPLAATDRVCDASGPNGGGRSLEELAERHSRNKDWPNAIKAYEELLWQTIKAGRGSSYRAAAPMRDLAWVLQRSFESGQSSRPEMFLAISLLTRARGRALCWSSSPLRSITEPTILC